MTLLLSFLFTVQVSAALRLDPIIERCVRWLIEIPSPKVDPLVARERAVLIDPRAWLRRAAINPDKVEITVTRADWTEIVGGESIQRRRINFNFYLGSDRPTNPGLGWIVFDYEDGRWIVHSTVNFEQRGRRLGTFLYATAAYVSVNHLGAPFYSYPHIGSGRTRSRDAEKLWKRWVGAGLAEIVSDDPRGPHFRINAERFGGDIPFQRYIESVITMSSAFTRMR